MGCARYMALLAQAPCCLIMSKLVDPKFLEEGHATESEGWGYGTILRARAVFGERNED
jgi:hypothetical protein